MSNVAAPASSILVLDWDGVVFADDAYKEALFAALTKLGLDRAQLQELYQSSKDHNGYNDVRFAAATAEVVGSKDEAVYAIIQGVAQRAVDFIFDDAAQFIKQAESENHEVVILTAGDENIQMQKIVHSKLRDFFRDVHVVPVSETASNKTQVIEKLLAGHGQLLFFDDKITTILRMHEAFRNEPKVVPVWVQRTRRFSSDDTNGFVVADLQWEEVKKHNVAFSKNRTLIAGTVIPRGETFLLAQEKGRATGLWSTPIGHVEVDEGFADCIPREVTEETGYEIELTGFRKLIAVDGSAYNGGDQDIPNTVIIACFNSSVIGGSLRPDHGFVLDAQWYSHEQIQQLPLRGEWERTLLFKNADESL